MINSRLKILSFQFPQSSIAQNCNIPLSICQHYSEFSIAQHSSASRCREVYDGCCLEQFDNKTKLYAWGKCIVNAFTLVISGLKFSQMFTLLLSSFVGLAVVKVVMVLSFYIFTILPVHVNQSSLYIVLVTLGMTFLLYIISKSISS